MKNTTEVTIGHLLLVQEALTNALLNGEKFTADHDNVFMDYKAACDVMIELCALQVDISNLILEATK